MAHNSLHLEYDFEKILEQMDIHMKKICIKYTHVLIGADAAIEDLISMNKVKYTPISHISRNKYFEKASGYVFHKKINTFLMKHFERM